LNIQSEFLNTLLGEGTRTKCLFGLHWVVPAAWHEESFDDSVWPNATTFNSAITVDHKSAYTIFTYVFANSSADIEFTWSKNVVLDNEVIVTY
jgi:hypothetical protein